MKEENKNNALSDEEVGDATGGVGEIGEIDYGPHYCFDCNRWNDAIWEPNNAVCLQCPQKPSAGGSH